MSVWENKNFFEMQELFNAKVISEVDGSFTLVGTIGISAISKLNGGSGCSNVKAIRIGWSHV